VLATEGGSRVGAVAPGVSSRAQADENEDRGDDEDEDEQQERAVVPATRRRQDQHCPGR